MGVSSLKINYYYYYYYYYFFFYKLAKLGFCFNNANSSYFFRQNESFSRAFLLWLAIFLFYSQMFFTKCCIVVANV